LGVELLKPFCLMPCPLCTHLHHYFVLMFV
jgi:hypothetical protein